METAEIRQFVNGPESFTPDGKFMFGEMAEVKKLCSFFLALVPKIITIPQLSEGGVHASLFHLFLFHFKFVNIL